MQNNIEQNRDANMDSAHENESAPYLKTYQLFAPPFSSSTTLSLYYSDADRQQYLNHLLHLVQSSDLIQVVVGEHGSGKSTLVQKFIQQAGPGLRCCHIKASAGLSEQDLLSALAACLELPDNLNSSALLELLWEQGFNLQRNDLTPVILIDDAQNLPAKTLAMLLQLQNIGTVDEDNNESPWRIILFTLPSQTLELLELNTPLHFIELTEFTEQQTTDYLNHRLRAAGLKQASPFTKKDIAFIHKHAEGNLHQMHQLAHQVLVEKQASPAAPVAIPKTESRNTNKKITIKPSAWLSMLAVVVLTVVLFFQDKINQLVETGETDKPAMTSQSHDLPEPPELAMEKIPDPVPVEIVTTTDTEANTPATPVIAEDSLSPDSSSDMAAPTAVEDVTIPTPDSEVATPTPVENVPAAAVATGPALKQAPVILDKELAPVAVKKPLPPVSAKKPATPEAASGNTSAALTLARTLEAQGIQGKSWIMKQPAASITAQMMASSSADTLIRQAKIPALGGKTAIYHILRKNKDWYVLLYGSEENRTSMRKSLDKLPAALRKNKPWIRVFSAVQAEIAAGKK